MPLSVMSKDNDDIDGNTKLATKPKTKIPSFYRVLMMNDDYTPMEFVIEVLEKFFQKNREEATQIMLHVELLSPCELLVISNQNRYGRAERLLQRKSETHN